jgi:hypothetical protein
MFLILLFISIVVSFIISIIFTYPYYFLKKRFERISKLDFNFKPMFSIFYESSKIYKNLDKMVSMLKEFRKYLSDTVLINGDGDEENKPKKSSILTNIKGKMYKKKKSVVPAVIEKRISIDSERKKKNSSTGSTSISLESKNKFSIGLDIREIGTIVVKFNNLFSILNKIDIEKKEKLLSDFLGLSQNIAHLSKGILKIVKTDLICINYNVLVQKTEFIDNFVFFYF